MALVLCCGWAAGRWLEICWGMNGWVNHSLVKCWRQWTYLNRKSMAAESTVMSVLGMLCFFGGASSSFEDTSGISNGHEFKIACNRSNIEISNSVRHGAKEKLLREKLRIFLACEIFRWKNYLISVRGAAKRHEPLELRNKCVVCLMPIVISGRFGKSHASSSRWNSSNGTNPSFRTSLKSARGTDTDSRNRVPLMFRCSSPSTMIGANISLWIEFRC